MSSEIKFIPFQDTEEAINKIAIVPGRILYTTDTKKTFLDIGTHRIEFNIVDKELNDKSNNPISNSTITKKIKELELAGYTLPIASEKELGGVRVGGNIFIDDVGVINIVIEDNIIATSKNPVTSEAIFNAIEEIQQKIIDSTYHLPSATKVKLGGVKIGKGINIDENGVISTDIIADQELDILSKNAISNNAVSNKFEEIETEIKLIAQKEYILPTATTQTKGGVIIGNYLEMDNEGRLNVSINPALLNIDSELNLDSESPVKNKVIASKFNEVKTNLEQIKTELTLQPATEKKLGGIIVGDNLEIKEDGTLNAVAAPYELPVASNEELGGIIVGDNLEITKEGVLSAVAEPYELPIASVDIIGGIKVGNNLTIDEDGTLNAQAGGSGIKIQEVTKAYYDKLPEAEKKNGTLYFIKDWNPSLVETDIVDKSNLVTM